MKLIGAFLAGALLAGAGVFWLVTPPSPVVDGNHPNVAEAVREQNPQFTNSNIHVLRNLAAFNLPEWYEISLAGQGMVVNANGEVAIVGDIFALQDIRNLSAEFRNERIAQVAAEQIRTLDTDILVSYPAANNVPALGEIWVFTDPTCPYCRRLHEQQPQLAAAGVTLHYIPYPRNGINNGRDYDQLVAIMCAANPAVAMHDFKSGNATESYLQHQASNDSACRQKVHAGLTLGQTIGISGTPFIIKSTGGVIAGFNSAPAIIQQLRAGQ